MALTTPPICWAYWKIITAPPISTTLPWRQASQP